MKKTSRILAGIIGIMFSSIMAHAQNYIKTDVGVTFLGGKKFIQSFDFNLNRTDEVQNSNGGIYFLYSPVTHFYIIPTVEANIGESVTAANNNIITQVTFGKALESNRHVTGSSVDEFKISLELSPTYNADKSFQEKLYYAQVKLYLNPIFSSFTGAGATYFAEKVFSFAIDPVVNLGTHNSQIYNSQHTYSAAGVNSTISLRLNKLDSKNIPYTDWAFELTGDEYRLFSEIQALYAKNYYGQLSASVDKALNSKISFNISYKYGNENAKYSDVNTLSFGFNYKY